MKVYDGINGVTRLKNDSGGKVSTCLVDGDSKKAATTEYTIYPGDRKVLPFKSGYGAAGDTYRLYMRSGYFTETGFEIPNPVIFIDDAAKGNVLMVKKIKSELMRVAHSRDIIFALLLLVETFILS